MKELGCDVTVKRNDLFEIDDIKDFDAILISPGPGIPSESGKTLEVLRHYSESKNILGVCLGQQAIAEASSALTHAAGNFYINDKPTGAVVGQQPFGGSRASGTNDKAGSMFNLARWVSQRTVKENFDPPTDYRYPFLEEN